MHNYMKKDNILIVDDNEGIRTIADSVGREMRGRGGKSLYLCIL